MDGDRRLNSLLEDEYLRVENTLKSLDACNRGVGDDDRHGDDDDDDDLWVWVKRFALPGRWLAAR